MTFRALSCLAACAMPAVRISSQVVRVNGGVSNIESNQGVTVGVYQANSTSYIGAGTAQGLHLGARREVQDGNASLALGDSVLQLKLRTDSMDAPRVFTGRGLSYQRSGTTNDALFFGGFTGNNFSNAFFNSVDTESPVVVAGMQHSWKHWDVSELFVRGVNTSALISVGFTPVPSTLLAMTAGVSDCNLIVRTLVRKEDGVRRLDLSYTKGELRMQPTQELQDYTLERIGLNASASQHLGRRFIIDVARSEYATSQAAANPIYAGVTATHSQLIEGGVTGRFGSLQVGVRVLHSVSSPVVSDGQVVIAGWNSRLWSVQAIGTTNKLGLTQPLTNGPTVGTSRSGVILYSQRVTQRIRLDINSDLGDSSGIGLGGSFEGNRLSFAVSHSIAFIPFGNQTGFHSVLTLSARIRLRETEVIASTTQSSGLPRLYSISTDGYYGALGSEQIGSSHFPSLPRYTVQGVVVDAHDDPIRGAAVLVGDQMMFTGSDGEFLARFSKQSPVRVSLRPEAFLTTRQYRAISNLTMVAPTEDTSTITRLHAEACYGCVTSAQPGISDVDTNSQATSALRRAFNSASVLTSRMLHIRNKAQ